MKKRVNLQFIIFLATCFCYLLVLILYIINSIAMNSFLYQIISVGSYFSLSLLTGIFFILQAKYHKSIFSIIALVLSILKLVIFFIFFLIIDVQNLCACYLRMSGVATNPVSSGDFIFFICTIIMAVVVLVSAILGNVAFIMYKKKESIPNQETANIS
jgi:hypothetical protein